MIGDASYRAGNTGNPPDGLRVIVGQEQEHLFSRRDDGFSLGVERKGWRLASEGEQIEIAFPNLEIWQRDELVRRLVRPSELDAVDRKHEIDDFASLFPFLPLVEAA